MVQKKISKKCLVVLLCLFSWNAYAFETVDEQIDHYLEILNGDSVDAKVTMLKQLQWSGLSNPRLYDEIETQILSLAFDEIIKRNEETVIAHQIRALGYSGNEKYRETLDRIVNESERVKHTRHASLAKEQLEKFSSWNKMIAESDLQTEGKSVEIATYMKMLSVNNPSVQKLAARAVFHENIQDQELIALAADELSALYTVEGLDGEAQDAAAWLCKAIGQSGIAEYQSLLADVVSNTPYPKIKKHASKYVN